MKTDILVIGSGIAGLTFATKMAAKHPNKHILVLTKAKKDEETNTKYAQGGIAVVDIEAGDSFEKHIKDTHIAGDGLCNPKIVDIVVKEGPERVQEIIDWGTQFDKEKDGTFSKGKEGGHSEYRILHHKDITGYEIERALLKKAKTFSNITIQTEWHVIDLITQHHKGYLITKSTENIECYGVYALNIKTQKVEKILSSITLIATGGLGQVYRSTTNPNIATGDGVAMVYRAKGRIENMEFIQFHPTALYEFGISPSFLITEAIRGAGAILRNHKGEAFMERYDKRKDLAPRDIVARAIDQEMKKEGTEFVFLDTRHLGKKVFESHFPTIFAYCKSKGLNPLKDLLPIAPAAHYSCGGIKTNEYGESSIHNLFACGECASTGLHGANRLASNSLLEALVFAHRCHLKASEILEKASIPTGLPDWDASGTKKAEEHILITQSFKELKAIMSDYVGIVRNDLRLERAMRRIDLLHEEVEKLYEESIVSPTLIELRNSITSAYLIVKGAIFRKESRGLHYTIDYKNHSTIIQNIIL